VTPARWEAIAQDCEAHGEKLVLPPFAAERPPGQNDESGDAQPRSLIPVEARTRTGSRGSSPATSGATASRPSPE
jgi:hypothetical protein